MGLLLKHRDKDNKWRLWTTISDGWLTGWLNEKEVKKYRVDQIEFDAKLKVIEELMAFPNGFTDYDTHKRLSGPVTDFYEWHLEVLKSPDYEKIVEAKYKESIKGLT